MDYLKNEQHYIDLYDLFTVKECLRVIEFWHKSYKEHSNDKEIKGLSKEERLKNFNQYLNLNLYTAKGERYQRKNQSIQEWIEKDRTKQEKLDSTPEPFGIDCSHCGTRMFMTSKVLEDYMNQPLRVLFFFECPSCKKRKGIYDNCEEHTSKPRLCPKCRKEVKVTHKKKGQIITWITTCPTCGFTEKEVDDYEKKHAEWQKEEQEDKKLLEKYRGDFCLSDEKGKEYIEMVEAMEVANVVREEEMQKYDNPVYQRALQLKKITVADLEKLLIEALERAKYIKLSFEKPEIGQYVIVPFTVQDSDSTRKDRISSSELEKLIKNTLEDTNWRLQPNSVIYRLGYLEGRLKGYEQEEGMLKLAGKKEEVKPKPKIDDAKRQKYAHHNLVQLARLFGEHDGIENMRKRRLTKEPEGFFLEPDKGPYDCGICGQGHYGNEIWWNLDGLRCADCWRNIKDGVIPSLKHRYDDNNSWFQDWQIESDFGVHPATRGKLKREGLLKGRDLKNEKGQVYYTIYLISENQEFLKKYPRKNKKIRDTILDKDSKPIEL